MRNRAAWCRWLWPVLLSGCSGEIDSAAVPFGGAGAPGSSIAPGAGLPLGAPGAINPGRVVAHRLNRVEYDNTIRDLFGVDSKPSSEFGFPEDNYVEGFDNNALSLTASPLLLEKYQSAAAAIVSRALAAGPSRSQIMTCDPSQLGAMPCATQILTGFATRAFRRPVLPDEITPYTALLATATSVGDGFEQAIATALQAMLLSPKFVFRTEQNGVPGQVAPLAAYELASRLSYYIWSSMPDAELMLRAADQSLRQPAEIRKQVARMLADPKASALVDNLAGQWLATRELAVKQITLKDFTLDEALRQAIAQEASLFLGELLRGQHTISELLASDFTYVNKALAQHYGMPEAATLGAALQRVTVSDPNRRAGLLTQTNFLIVSSQRDRTSPTRRGKWVSENLLCVVIPPPPPKIPELVMNDASMPTSTRERLEAHRRKGSTCNGCHMYMDPLGLAFEHYDAVGRYRTTDLGAAIDTTGEVPITNVPFDDVPGLAAALENDPRVSDCVLRKFLTYALGRGLVLNAQPGDPIDDAAAFAALRQQLMAAGDKLPALIELIAESPMMTMRVGEL